MKNCKKKVENETFRSIITLQDFLEGKPKSLFINEYSLIFTCLECLLFLNLFVRMDHSALSKNIYLALLLFQISIISSLLIFRMFCTKYKYKVYKIITSWIIILFIYLLLKFIVLLIITTLFDSYQLLIHILINQSTFKIEISCLFFIYLIMFLGIFKIFSTKLKTFKGKILILEFIVVFFSFVLVLLFLFSLFIFQEAPYMVISILIFVFHTLVTILLPFIFIKRVKEIENLKYFFYMFSMVKIFLTKIILFKFLTEYFIYKHGLKIFLNFYVLTNE
ncbi:hypothetical protein TUBRATIS_30780 [Tubulinosema ratisbonensis]|uniref:Uncharacterized protein n=1 Tax=Tubulinosema ratisbonensis TaxID=291195 RepID=A0A437AHF8_9MICR|nr:hypothetical protein TUBRATIS_30780 [Tubulinosema ratisbonensis]